MKHVIQIAILVIGIAGIATAGDVRPPCEQLAMDDLLMAQAPPDSPMGGSPRMGFGPDGPGGRMPGMGPMRHLEQFRLLKLLEFLDLKEDQETQFISKYRQMRKEEREADQQERELVDRLATQIKQGKTDDKAVSARTDSIMKIQDQRWRARQDRLSQFKAVLTTEQWAKFIIFHERFEQEMLEQVRGFRDRDMGRRNHDEDRAKQDSSDDKN